MSSNKEQFLLINERPEGMPYEEYKRLRSQQKKAHKFAYRVWDNAKHGTYTVKKAAELKRRGIPFA